MFYRLHEYQFVDSVGLHLKNIDTDIGPAYMGDWTKPKVEFQRRYDFTIACENSSSPGYTTEKIVHAFAADTIPIYWGNPEISREFNPGRFINCRDYDSIESVVARVIEIQKNPQEKEKILRQPFFPNNQDLLGLSDQAILNQFSRIFAQDKDKAMRRNRYLWGARYEDDRFTQSQATKFLYGTGLRGRLSRILMNLR
ncbi:MAG: glycosyltransferase family 10 [Cyanobacteria bacterium P01_D01_bin.6]